MHFKRGKRKVIADYKIKDIYKYYKDKCKKKRIKWLEYTQFIKIHKIIYENIMNRIIYEGAEFTFSYRLGGLRIKKKKQVLRLDKEGNVDKRSLSVNWKKTKILWNKQYFGKTFEEIKKIKNKPLIYELNEHTDGYRFSFFWDKITCNVPNQSAYYFEPIRKYKERLAIALKTIKNLEYYE